jgi:hypothetical protein
MYWWRRVQIIASVSTAKIIPEEVFCEVILPSDPLSRIEIRKMAKL